MSAEGPGSYPVPPWAPTGLYGDTARDYAHAFYAQITLAEQRGHWLVVELTSPDFVQALAPAGPPPAAPPPESAGAENAARLFLRGYLPWLYGRHRSARSPPRPPASS